MATKPTKRPVRQRPKLITKADQDALAAQHEAKRLGAVAFHRGKGRDACQLGDDDPLREHWLEGYDRASVRKNRLDMSPARATGFRAFQDGLRREDCPLRGNAPERSEWLDGWEAARRAKEKHDELYR